MRYMLKRFLLLCVCTCMMLVALAACSGGIGPTPTAGTSPTSSSSPVVSPMPSPTASPTTTPTVTPTPSPTSTPGTITSVVTAYYQAIEAQNYALAYTYLDTNATTTDGQKLTLNTFMQLAQTGDNSYGPVVSFSFEVYPPLVVMSLARKSLSAYHAHLTMKQEGNTWKIMTIDRI